MHSAHFMVMVNVACNSESFIVTCSGTSVTADKFKRVGDKEKVFWKHRNTRRKCGLNEIVVAFENGVGSCANWDVLL